MEAASKEAELLTDEGHRPSPTVVVFQQRHRGPDSTGEVIESKLGGTLAW